CLSTNLTRLGPGTVMDEWNSYFCHAGRGDPWGLNLEPFTSHPARHASLRSLCHVCAALAPQDKDGFLTEV
ncbi:hypothetical protein BaRGS_00015221, partial [Batillaria attramentaria]